ncbi:Holliday junction ATP-dependent DNA helicaseRuvA [Striga asiatica]|uniref:Holliday junction ATP-dependent DNA helicaseRuvA n=1 Tax=Striga asiatica TaxID=4170 RepID=A0A5A7Q1E5_STRAF|nr:Holliday junction ATP-dependent DNA helicaseRuvA [Striga asiatica]
MGPFLTHKTSNRSRTHVFRPSAFSFPSVVNKGWNRIRSSEVQEIGLRIALLTRVRARIETTGKARALTIVPAEIAYNREEFISGGGMNTRERSTKSSNRSWSNRIFELGV